MKKILFYTAMSLVVLSSCQNDDEAGIAGGPVDGAPLSELRVKVSSSSPATKTTSTGVGAENKLARTFVFANVDADGDVSTVGYEYQVRKITGNATSTTFKLVEPNSAVYVLANPGHLTDAQVDQLVADVNGSRDAVLAFQAIESIVPKDYIYELNSTTGSFMMSGYASAPSVVATPFTMDVEVNRDLAKVDFLVNKDTPVTGDLDGDATLESYTLKGVKSVSVHRVAQKVKPFAVRGVSDWSYELTPGFGESGYLQDQANGTAFADPFSNLTATTNATDYTYIHEYKGNVDADNYVFDTFYTTPNAADRASRGTILVLEAELVNDADNSTITRYYKARVSNSLDAFITGKNTHYKIVATINGIGNALPIGPGSPDEELDSDDLQVNVSVQDWKFVVSDQVIE